MEIAILTNRKRYSRKTKTTEADIAEGNRVPFVDFMENLDTKPGKEEWETTLNKDVSPHLENPERQIHESTMML